MLILFPYIDIANYMYTKIVVSMAGYCSGIMLLWFYGFLALLWAHNELHFKNKNGHLKLITIMAILNKHRWQTWGLCLMCEMIRKYYVLNNSNKTV